MRVALITGPSAGTMDGAYTIKAWLDSQGIETAVWSANIYDGCDPDDPLFVEDSSKVRESDLVLVFGGDGTTLRAARLVGYEEIPILSYNFGHLGFLASDDNNHMIARLATVLSGEVEPVRHTTLDVEILDTEGKTWNCFALNEAAVARGAKGHLVPFKVNIDGVRVFDTRGDGIIAATSTGSTAYALSAGGPIIAPDNRGILVQPIACHTLNTRPVITGPSDTVEIIVGPTLPEDPVVFIDGQVLHTVPATVTVNRGPGDVLIYRFDESTFYETLVSVFL